MSPFAQKTAKKKIKGLAPPEILHGLRTLEMLNKSDTFKKCLQDMEADFTEKSLTVSMAVVRGITEVDTALLSAWNIKIMLHFLCRTTFFIFAINGRIRRKKGVSF